MRAIYLLNTLETGSNFEFSTPVNLETINQLNEDNPIGFWLIDASTDIKAAKKLLTALRQQIVPNLYLRPVVFCFAHQENQSDIDLMGCDGVFYKNENTKTQISALISKFEMVNQWIDKLPDSYKATDTDLIFRILRLIVSRNYEINPIMTTQSLNGFVYPLLESISQQSDNSFFHVLDFLEVQHLITGRFISHCYLCCQCHGAFLNFKEVCPECESEDIDSEELIHHFKCAYVGEKSSFQQGDELNCPKCDRKLKHIGVDYDKPSTINHCNQCGASFQEANVMTKCFNCHSQAEPENQLNRTIKAYNSTAIGKNAAIFGLETLFTKIISSKVSFFSETQFKQFLEVEKERIRRYKLSTSSLGFIKFIDIEKIYLQQGAKSEQFFEELSLIFKSILRVSDIITTQNQSLFIMIFTETSEKNSIIAMERLIEGLSVLLNENLGYTAKIPFKIEAINGYTNLNSLLESFISDHEIT